jgi:2-alkyl-3-oxoalkanoate reductase
VRGQAICGCATVSKTLLTPPSPKGGEGVSPDSGPPILGASLAVAAGARRYAKLEAAASRTPHVGFVSLRYGFFYGPGTRYSGEGDIGEQVRQQRVPVIDDGQGVWSYVHVDDAATAMATALECPPGKYNQ